MPLQTSGTISLSDIQNEFTGTNPISLSEYYRNGAFVPDAAVNNNIPTTGTISLSDFYGGTRISYTLSRNVASIYETETVTITLTTVGVSDNTQVPYTITGIAASDLTSNTLTGNFTIVSNTATQTFTADYDGVVEGDEVATLTLDNNEDSITWTILAPTFSLARSASNINEGGSITITLTTNGIPNSTTIPYTITGIDSNDLSSGSLTGNFTINSGTATQSFTLANDFTTEGVETAILTLSSPGSGNISWTINDTSVPTYTLSRSAASIYESQSVDITLTTQGVPDSTNIPYTITGISSGDIEESLTGNFTIVSGTDTLTFTAVVDNLNESTETATLTLGSPGSGSITWQILQPTFTLSRSAASIYEGQSVTITLTTVGIANGTEIPYTITGMGLNVDLLETINNPSAYDIPNDDEFGRSVDSVLVGNDEYLVVGAWKEDEPLPPATSSGLTNYSESGKAYVFKNNELLFVLDNPNNYSTPTQDQFGTSVAISSSYILVGAPAEGPSGGFLGKKGRAYLFDITDGSLLYTFEDDATSGTQLLGNAVALTNSYAVVAQSGYNNGTGRVNVYDPSTGSLLRRIDGSGSASFGSDVAINGTDLLIGASGADVAATNSGAAYLYDASNGSLIYTLANPNAYSTAAGDSFGGRVAITDDYMIVSALDEDDATGSSSGKVYVFNRSDGSSAYTINNPNPYSTGASDQFGYSLDANNSYIVVGTPFEDSAAGSSVGRVYIFDITNGNLIKTLATNTTALQEFGFSVSIHGTTVPRVYVGEWRDTTQGSGSGVVHHYEIGYELNESVTGNFTVNSNTATQTFTARQDSVVESAETATLTLDNHGTNITWQILAPTYTLSRSASNINEGQTQTITLTTNGVPNGTEIPYTLSIPVGVPLQYTLDNPNAYSTSASDFFGYSVSVSNNYAVVSAPQEDENPTGTGSGKVYIFNATTGALLSTIDNPNPYGTASGDNFGQFVAVSGTKAIIGTPYEDDTGGIISGKAYIYNVTNGTLTYTLNNPNAYSTSASDFFGGSVAISTNYSIVGAMSEDDPSYTSSGKAYIFSNSTGALVYTLTNPNNYNRADEDRFGYAVAITDTYAVVGTDSESSTTLSESGVAYVFSTSTGNLLHTIVNPEPVGTGRFGSLVAISGDYAIIGSYNSTKVYIYDLTKSIVLANDYLHKFTVGANASSVAISDIYAVVGSRLTLNGGAISASGSVYVYRIDSGELVKTIDNPNAYDTPDDDNFGSTVSIDGRDIVVGTGNLIYTQTEDDAGGTNSGKAYIFKINTSDLSSGSYAGNFTISGGSATQSFTLANDFTVEGTETATLTLGSPGSGNITWTINDTSVPTFALSRSASTVSEGNSFTITLTTQGVPDGTTVGYTITGVNSNDINVSLTGNFTVSSNTATLSVSASVNDDAVAYALGVSGIYEVVKQYAVTQDLQTTSYISQFNLSNVSGFSQGLGMYLKSDGTRLWVQDPGTDKFWRWTLSPAWDLSSATSVASASYGTVGGNHQGMWISPAGISLYQVDRTLKYIMYDSLGTTWDPFSPGNPARTLDISTNASLPNGIAVKADGTVAFISNTGSTGGDILEFSGTGNRPDLWTFQNEITITGSVFPTDVFVNEAGTKMYVPDDSAKVHYFELSTGWDLTTASLIRTWDLSSDFSIITAFYIASITSETFNITLAATDSVGNSTGSPNITVTITG